MAPDLQDVREALAFAQRFDLWQILLCAAGALSLAARSARLGWKAGRLAWAGALRAAGALRGRLVPPLGEPALAILEAVASPAATCRAGALQNGPCVIVLPGGKEPGRVLVDGRPVECLTAREKSAVFEAAGVRVRELAREEWEINRLMLADALSRKA